MILTYIDQDGDHSDTQTASNSKKKIQHFSHDLVVRHDGNRSHGLRKALLPKVSSFFCCEGGMEKLDAPNDQIFYPNISKISSKTGWCFQVKFRRYSAKDLS